MGIKPNSASFALCVKFRLETENAASLPIYLMYFYFILPLRKFPQNGMVHEPISISDTFFLSTVELQVLLRYTFDSNASNNRKMTIRYFTVDYEISTCRILC